MKPHRFLFLIAFLMPVHVRAESVIVSYDSASAEARRLTGAGLTLVVERGWLGRSRVRQVRATGVPVGARMEPADLSSRELAAGINDPERADLPAAFEINLATDQGSIMARAFCPGADRVWLLFGRMPYRAPIDIMAIGRDPVTGAVHNCARMSFTWRGEWRLPKTDRPDPVRMLFNDSGPMRR